MTFTDKRLNLVVGVGGVKKPNFYVNIRCTKKTNG